MRKITKNMLKEITREEWGNICFEIAQNHPEFFLDTFKSFSDGITEQAEYNSEKVASMGAALSMLYKFPNSKKWKKLAREKLIESKLFLGTQFEKELLLEGK